MIDIDMPGSELVKLADARLRAVERALVDLKEALDVALYQLGNSRNEIYQLRNPGGYIRLDCAGGGMQ